MLEPLKQWICDVCGGEIEKAEDGYVVWGHGKSEANSLKDGGFKIIHQGKCDDHKLPSSAALTDFLGPDGLTYLLAFLSPGPIITSRGKCTHVGILDQDEYVDFFRRVQTPYYEEARQYFDTRELLEDYYDANEIYPYQTHILQKIIETYGKNG